MSRYDYNSGMELKYCIFISLAMISILRILTSFCCFFFNLVWFCLYAYLHVVLLPALKICNFKWQNLYGMKKQKKNLDFSSYFNRTREQIRPLKFLSRRSFQGEGH